MATRDRSFWIMLIFILCGLVIGGLLGDLASNVNELLFLFIEKFGKKGQKGSIIDNKRITRDRKTI